MGWLSGSGKEKREATIAQHEGVIERIGSYSPGEYTIHLIWLKGHASYLRMEASRHIEELIALSQPGDRVEMTIREASASYGVCVDFFNHDQEALKAAAKEASDKQKEATEPTRAVVRKPSQ